MRNFQIFILMVGLSVFLTANAKVDEGFPGRKDFPDVPVMELKELFHKLNDVVIVDARSRLEFDTLRILNSINIPVANENFEDQVLKLRQANNKSIVFYCNGRSCHKSYIAAKKSMVAGINDVYAYDAGIFEWATAHPNKAVLLGKTPVNVKSLISINYFKKKLLNPDVFSEKIVQLGNTSMVLDVRDKFQRAGIGFYPGKERWCSLDQKKKLEKYLQQAKLNGKTLFIYDEVGKQVEWLQYTLEEMGIKDYYFMQNGAKAYYSSIAIWKP